VLLAVLSGFILAAVAPALERRLDARAGGVLALLPAGLFVFFILQAPLIVAGERPAFTLDWLPTLGMRFALALDGLGLLLALMVTLVGTAVFVYAGAYLKGDPQRGRFFAVSLVFMAAMLGVVLADDLLTLFVFWELTGIASYLLVGHKHTDAAARAAALQALLVTGAGGLALLGGLLLLGQAAGTYEIGALGAQAEAVRAHPLYLPMVLLVLAGAFTKSAQVPFHFWLPGAMAAPTPASAYLHSATMVKAGVFLLARLNPVLGGTEIWHTLLAVAGAATMLAGALMALFQTDLKRLLAYTTLAALGTLTLLLGIGSVEAVKAALVLLLVHALYKATLFLVAGLVDHETGTRDLALLGGLRAAMPVTAAVALLAGLSMAGLPPLVGFVAKELLYEAKLGAPQAPLLLTLAGVLANVATVAAAGLLVLRVFFGARRATPRPAHEGPPAMLVGPLVLAVVSVLLGVLPDALVGSLVGAAVGAVRAEPTHVTLALWHGLSPVLLLSVATVLAGAAVWAWHAPLVAALAPGRVLARLGPQRAWTRGWEALFALAKAQTRALDGGPLRRDVLVTVLVGAGLPALALVATRSLAWPAWNPPTLLEAALAALILVAALAVVRAPSRLQAVAALGVVGFAIALVFLLFGGPDLALTQFAVETLSVILFVLVLWRLPRFVPLSSRATRLRDAAVAAGAGTLVAALAWTVTATPARSELRRFFAEASVPQGQGRNVVNVILVDFRALDTLGEISVLAAAALGVVALVRRRPRPSGVAPAPAGPSPILATAARGLLPLMLVLALFLLLRGHNDPGGGFVGGLVVACGFGLYALALGVEQGRRALRVAPRTLIAAGLGTALVSGLFGLAGGRPFMAALWPGALPVVGKLGTPLLFDFGVLLVVAGVALAMLFALLED
jgi:multicomponent Na+:H+ antiporter subunit A